MALLCGSQERWRDELPRSRGGRRDSGGDIRSCLQERQEGFHDELMVMGLLIMSDGGQWGLLGFQN